MSFASLKPPEFSAPLSAPEPSPSCWHRCSAKLQGSEHGCELLQRGGQRGGCVGQCGAHLSQQLQDGDGSPHERQSALHRARCSAAGALNQHNRQRQGDHPVIVGDEHGA